MIGSTYRICERTHCLWVRTKNDLEAICIWNCKTGKAKIDSLEQTDNQTGTDKAVFLGYSEKNKGFRM